MKPPEFLYCVQNGRKFIIHTPTSTIVELFTGGYDLWLYDPVAPHYESMFSGHAAILVAKSPDADNVPFKLIVDYLKKIL